MRTQETFSLIQSAQEIRVALETDRDRIGGKLNGQNPMPVGEGEPTFDYRLHIDHLIRQLVTAVDETTEAEDQHATRLIRVTRAQDERDDEARKSRDKLVKSRQALESVFPEGGFELAHVSGKTPRVPARLAEQLEQTVQLLEKPAVELRQAKVRGFNADLGEVATDLAACIPGLRAAIDHLDVARKQAEGTLFVKQRAVDELKRVVLWVGRTAEGLFHLAGEPELAGRIRSSTRRPTRPSEEAAAGEGDGAAEEPDPTDQDPGETPPDPGESPPDPAEPQSEQP